MMTVMCPNCRHRFPTPGCCNPGGQIKNTMMHQSSSECGSSYNCNGILIPPSYNNNNGGGCFINAPTIINGPTIIQSMGHNSTNKIEMCTSELDRDQMKNVIKSTNRKISTTCDLTGGTITITTPIIQSGGCVIQSNHSDIILQAPHIEIKQKLSGGSCLVQKRFSTEDLSSSEINFTDDRYSEALNGIRYFDESPLNEDRTEEMIIIPPPSGCQELPGIQRQNSTVKTHGNYSFSNNFTDSKIPNSLNNDIYNDNKKRVSNCCCGSSSHFCHDNNLSSTSANNSIPTADVMSAKTIETNNSVGSVQIQVNATVQLPPNMGQCIVNITANTNQNNFDTSINTAPTTVRSKNNFHGGGLIQMDTSNSSPLIPHENTDRNYEAPIIPLSWLRPLEFGYYPQVMNFVKPEVKRLLHTCGWYHAGLDWRQSENLLKNAPIGRWLMRDSSDTRYIFAISVQTARGPTSVRVYNFLGRFKLDSEPRLTFAMPLFECPIKMLEYYVKYSTMEENRREVWVDYSGHLYSQIYLTHPLVKEVRSLSHLARLVVNKNKLNIDHLPSPIKNYIAEYPYSF